MIGHIFEFLMYHGDKTLPPYEWEKLLHIKIIDADGWRDDKKNFDEPIPMMEFVGRTCKCTVKYQ